MTQLKGKRKGILSGQEEFYVKDIDGISYVTSLDKVLNDLSLKSGATQLAAGALVNEWWTTASHATLPDGVLMKGL